MTPSLIIDDSVKSFDVPLGDLRLQYPGKRLVVGVAIVSLSPNDSSGSQRKLLLLQRAETEDVYPLMYELPGGGAEPDDTTLLSTVVREAEEETGLTVTKIWGTFPGFEYETSKSKAIQFNFLAGVEAGTESNIRTNPKEHCAFAWVDKTDDLSYDEKYVPGSLRCTDYHRRNHVRVVPVCYIPFSRPSVPLF